MKSTLGMNVNEVANTSSFEITVVASGINLHNTDIESSFTSFSKNWEYNKSTTRTLKQPVEGENNLKM